MKTKKHIKFGLPLAIVLPLILVALFFPLRSCRPFIDFWVFDVVGPLEQFCGRICSVFSFSVVEAAAVLLIVGTLCTLISAALGLYRSKSAGQFLHRIGVLLALWLWILAAFYWLWNAAYYASSFSQRSGLSAVSYSTQELAQVTDYFAQNAARLSDRIQRDPELHWAEELESCIQRGTEIYDNMEERFPCLKMKSVKVKPLKLSRLQSIFGFTGVYSPFTGEANINIDAPAASIPSTIGHEMSHQRMIASELEANFIGIAACTTSDDVVFQYSGYLSGLMYLSSALHSAAPELWQSVVDTWFTPEMMVDWNDNHDYWQALSSPVDQIADQAYDAFLKGNDQPLGVRSYGACVDLLVAYYLPVSERQANAHSEPSSGRLN